MMNEYTFNLNLIFTLFNNFWYLYSFMILSLPFLINMMMIMIMTLPMNKNLHPMSMMFTLMLMTLLFSLKMNFIYYSIIPFILFLAMIGGLMIIFLYIISISNNEFFLNKLSNLIFNLIKNLPILMILIIDLYYNSPEILISIQNIQEIKQININQFIINQSNMNLMYNKINNNSTLFIMFYLYYSMINIMNICFKLKSPLRQMIN